MSIILFKLSLTCPFFHLYMFLWYKNFILDAANAMNAEASIKEGTKDGKISKDLVSLRKPLFVQQKHKKIIAFFSDFRF